jgi:hypothetical protein
VDNGGLISLYYNSGGEFVMETIEDLISIDSEDTAALLKQINNLFPNENPPKDINQRNEIINSWSEGEHDKLLNDLDNLFYKQEESLEKKLVAHILKCIS